MGASLLPSRWATPASRAGPDWRRCCKVSQCAAVARLWFQRVMMRRPQLLEGPELVPPRCSPLAHGPHTAGWQGSEDDEGASAALLLALRVVCFFMCSVRCR